MPFPRDSEPTNQEPPFPTADDDAAPTDDDMPKEPREPADRKLKERRGGEPKRVGKPNPKAGGALGKEGEAGFVKSSAENVHFNVFSVLSAFGLLLCAQVWMWLRMKTNFSNTCLRLNKLLGWFSFFEWVGVTGK
jgi:hypothetical protein